MINSSEIKQKLGKSTEQLETSLAPYYTSLEPWQRGTLLIALTLFLLFSVYYLTKTQAPLKSDPRKEKEIEEKILRQMAFFKKLKE